MFSMLPTVEARWFMAGPVPSEAQRWFQRWELAPSTERRTDSYLLLPGITSVGVKLRDGKFEVKRRDADFGLTPLGSRATGRLAFWRKWSFTITGSSGATTPDGHWVRVDKERHFRMYCIENANLTAVDPKVDQRSFPELGCTIELTRLEVGRAEWWSVGFAAFGPDEFLLRDTLSLVATNCFNSGDHPALHGEDSFDYPEWLALVHRVS